MRQTTLCLLAAALVGCNQSPEAKITGDWAGTARMSDDQIEAVIQRGGYSGGQAQSARLRLQHIPSTLSLRADKSCTLTLSGVPIGGTWSYIGNTLKMLPGSVAGFDPVAAGNQGGANVPEAPPMYFSSKSDVTELTLQPDATNGQMELTLRKSSK